MHSSKRPSLAFAAAAVAMLLQFAVGTARAAAADAPRPNIVLIMCDDMGYSDLGCYGSEIRTPHVDSLARDGLRFTHFYNNAKCTTTRASIVTGLYPRRSGPLLKESMVTLGEAIEAAGYQTALVGKWHLGRRPTTHPFHRGFQEYYGLLDGCCNYFDPNQPDPAFKGGRVRFFAHNDERITEFPDGFYTTDAFTDHAIATLEKFAAAGRPFFLHLCYTAPHYPLHAPPEDIARYRGKYLKGWDALRDERHKRQLAMGLVESDWNLPPRNPEASAWEDARDKPWQDLRMAVYAAMIDRMDQNVGRVLAALDASGVADNTLVMFLSDNGGCAEIPGGENPQAIPGPKEYYTTCGPGWAFAQNTPFRRYKSWVHEGGIATPLIVRWPHHVVPGTITHQVGHIIDILPTCLEAAGADYPDEYHGHTILPCEGLSLTPVLRGQSRPGHDVLYWEWAGNRAVRQGDWKLAWEKRLRRWELYNLSNDRTETNDLAAQQPEKVAALSALWFEWAQRTGLNVRQGEK